MDPKKQIVLTTSQKSDDRSLMREPAETPEECLNYLILRNILNAETYSRGIFEFWLLTAMVKVAEIAVKQ